MFNSKLLNKQSVLDSMVEIRVSSIFLGSLQHFAHGSPNTISWDRPVTTLWYSDLAILKHSPLDASIKKFTMNPPMCFVIFRLKYGFSLELFIKTHSDPHGLV